jgi:uncharacterized protein
MVSTRRLELERVFDSPWFTARLRRGVNEAAVRTAAFGLRLGGPRIARELPSLRVSSVTHFLPSLPAGADGCRLLHLSDLHLESLRAWQTVTGAMSGLDWDALLFTGDFAEGPDTTELVARFVSLLPERPQGPRVAVLGNHDRSGLLPALAAGGFEVLTNGSRPLGNQWGGVWIAGVDDPATFRTHDLDAAMSGVPADACTILMAHSPDLAFEASARGCALYLCGHTHGGQFVIPRFGPVGYRKRYPREQIAGVWHVDGMAGYTSVGLGARHGLVRVGCTPEITVHELRCLPTR